MKRYDQSFREEAVRLALTSGQPYAKTARDLGVKEANLYHWIEVSKKEAPVVADEKGQAANLVEELNRLRKENSRLKEEREILKKAAMFFAKDTK
jgi:transposase